MNSPLNLKPATCQGKGQAPQKRRLESVTLLGTRIEAH